MYMVVSRWEVLPGREQDFEERGRAVRQVLRSTPGVQFSEGFRTEDGGVVAVIGYESRDAYDRIVNDEKGPFQRALAAHHLEECSRWVSSERGESMQDG